MEVRTLRDRLVVPMLPAVLERLMRWSRPGPVPRLAHLTAGPRQRPRTSYESLARRVGHCGLQSSHRYGHSAYPSPQGRMLFGADRTPRVLMVLAWVVCLGFRPNPLWESAPVQYPTLGTDSVRTQVRTPDPPDLQCVDVRFPSFPHHAWPRHVVTVQYSSFPQLTSPMQF